MSGVALFVRRWAQASLCIFVCACSTKSGAARTDTLPSCAPHCRVLPDGTPSEQSVCRESVDCGERAHTLRMMCIAGGLCQTACANGWADCNSDYRDGCESPSEDGRCPGEEEPESDPSASVTCMRESRFAEPYDCDLFDDAADAASDALLKCYQTVLLTQPSVEAALTYSVAVAPDGRAREVALLEEEAPVPALKSCAKSVLDQLHLRSGPQAVYPCRVVFTPRTVR